MVWRVQLWILRGGFGAKYLIMFPRPICRMCVYVVLEVTSYSGRNVITSSIRDRLTREREEGAWFHCGLCYLGPRQERSGQA